MARQSSKHLLERVFYAATRLTDLGRNRGDICKHSRAGIGESSSPTALRRSVKIMIVLQGEISRQIIGLSRYLGERTAPTGLRHR